MQKQIIVIIAGLFLGTSSLWAQTKATNAAATKVMKTVAAAKHKAKALQGTRQRLASKIKATKAKEARLKQQLKQTQAALHALLLKWKQLNNGSNVQGMTVARCKKLMRRTFTPGMTPKDRQYYLNWCKENAHIAVEPQKLEPR